MFTIIEYICTLTQLLSRIQVENFGSVCTDVTGYKKTSGSLPVNSTRILTPTEAVDRLSSLQDVHGIRGDYIWMVNGELFDHSEANFRVLTQSNTIPAVVAITHCPNDKSIEAVSFACKTELTKGMLFRIDFYCVEGHRSTIFAEKLLRAHVLKHLGLFAQLRYKGMAFVDVLCHKEMTSQNIGSWMSSIVAAPNKLVDEDMKVYFVEYDVTWFRNNAKL